MNEKILAEGFSIEGSAREKNGDVFLCDSESGLYAVCDGVSGHDNPAVASGLCMKMIRERYCHILPKFNADNFRKLMAEAIHDGIESACREIYVKEPEKSGKSKMATTATVVAIRNQWAVIGHVGDSRAYILRSGVIKQLTEDHCVGREMLKSGQWTPEQFKQSPFSRVLTRAVGSSEFVRTDLLQLQLNDGDVILLCSDGVHESLKEEEMISLLSSSDSTSVIAKAITQKAVDAVGKDDTTAVVIRYQKQHAANEIMPKHKVEIIGKVPLFQFLSFTELNKVLAIAQEKSIKAGEELLHEGAIGKEMFVILSGQLDVRKSGLDIAKRNKGDTVGEMSIIDGSIRSASVVAKEDTVLLTIPRDPLFALMRSEPALSVKLLWPLCKSINTRLREVTEELVVEKTKLPTSVNEIMPF